MKTDEIKVYEFTYQILRLKNVTMFEKEMTKEDGTDYVSSSHGEKFLFTFEDSQHSEYYHTQYAPNYCGKGAGKAVFFLSTICLGEMRWPDVTSVKEEEINPYAEFIGNYYMCKVARKDMKVMDLKRMVTTKRQFANVEEISYYLDKEYGKALFRFPREKLITVYDFLTEIGKPVWTIERSKLEKLLTKTKGRKLPVSYLEELVQEIIGGEE